MHTTRVEDHGHGSPVGDLPIEACDFSLDQVHEGLALCAYPTAAGQYCQCTAWASKTARQLAIMYQATTSTNASLLQHAAVNCSPVMTASRQ